VLELSPMMIQVSAKVVNKPEHVSLVLRNKNRKITCPVQGMSRQLKIHSDE
jgi:hypothetical protein